MTAWVKRGTREEVGIITDYTDAESVYRHRSSALATQSDHRNIDCSLTEFNKKLVEQYLSIPWVETKCGYACSDQYVPNDPSERSAVALKPSSQSRSASWRKAGYPSVFTIGAHIGFVHIA